MLRFSRAIIFRNFMYRYLSLTFSLFDLSLYFTCHINLFSFFYFWLVFIWFLLILLFFSLDYNLDQFVLMCCFFYWLVLLFFYVERSSIPFIEFIFTWQISSILSLCFLFVHGYLLLISFFMLFIFFYICMFRSYF